MQSFDCETIRQGLVAQPVNTVSATAFFVAAVVLVRRRRPLEAVVIAVAGAGATLFHAAPSGASQWLHDVGLYAAVAFAVLTLWRRLAASDPPWAALIVFGAGIAVWAASRSTGPLCSPDSVIQGHAIWHILAAISFVFLIDTHRESATP